MTKVSFHQQPPKRIPARFLPLWLACFVPLAGLAQGVIEPITITFDGPPVLPPQSQYWITEYDESGFIFTPIPPISPGIAFTRNTGDIEGYPYDGTGYLQSDAQSLMFVSADGSPFNFLSIDLAEYSDLSPEPASMEIIGYHPDGSSVSTVLTTDGIIDSTGGQPDFQTFALPASFTDLVRVEFPFPGESDLYDAYSLDNIVLAVPEPSALSFISVAAALLWLTQRRLRRGYGMAGALPFS